MTRLGLEPRTYGLKVRCSTNWATGSDYTGLELTLSAGVPAGPDCNPACAARRVRRCGADSLLAPGHFMDSSGDARRYVGLSGLFRRALRIARRPRRSARSVTVFLR